MLRAALRGRHAALGATRAASAALGAKRNYSAKLACLDLEGVLIPEVWVNLAERVGLDSLKRTTRDEPDYNKLMRYRLDIMEKEGLTLKDIQAAIDTMEPLPGAPEMVAWLRERVAAMAGVSVSQLQPTKLTRYNKGEYFRPHSFTTSMCSASSIENAPCSCWYQASVPEDPFRWRFMRRPLILWSPERFMSRAWR